MQITKSDIHSASKDSNGGLSHGYDSELVVVIRAGDYERLRGLRDAIELLTDVHSRGPICTITEHNITPAMFDAAAAILDNNPDGLRYEIRSHTLTPSGAVEYRAALHKGMVRVKLGKLTALVEHNGSPFCINEQTNGATSFIHPVPKDSDLRDAIVHAAELLAKSA